MTKLIEPYSIKYDVLGRDEHAINVERLAYSMMGLSKISNSIIYFITNGEVAKRNYKKDFDCYSLPHERGSYEWYMFIAPVSMSLVSMPEFYTQGINMLHQKIWRDIMSYFRGQEVQPFEDEEKKFLIKMLDKYQDRLFNMFENQQKIISEIALSNKSNAINMVYPITKGDCATIQKKFMPTSLTINESDAEKINALSDIVIGDMEEFNCSKIVELNIDTGHCQVFIDGFDYKITGIVADPNVKRENNAYSTALDNHQGLIMKAKPELMGSELKRLHIFDAEVKP